MTQLINRRTLLSIIPLSERTILDMEKRGEFPRRIALTSRNVAWDMAEVQDWIATRKASADQVGFAGATPEPA
jgi:prophage regulatory protein